MRKTTFRASAGGKEFCIDREADAIFIGGERRKISLHALPDGRWFVREGLTGMDARILEISPDRKKVTIAARGHVFSIQLHDQLDEVLGKMNLNSGIKSLAGRLVAPMPGLIRSVLVEEEQQVEQGEALLVLEAMKMENLIRSAGPVSVRHVLVKPGDRVEKGQILMEFK